MIVALNFENPSGGNTGDLLATDAEIEELGRFAAEFIKVWKAGFWASACMSRRQAKLVIGCCMTYTIRWN